MHKTCKVLDNNKSPVKLLQQISLILFIIICFSESLSAYSWTSDMIEAYENISSFKLEKGRMILRKNNNRSNSLIPYLDSYADMIEIGITENKNAYDRFLNVEKERIKQIEGLEVSPSQDFLIAEIYLHEGFIKLKFGHEFQGAGDILKAYRILSKNIKKYPQFIPQYKSFGILQVVFGSVPKKFQWITKLLGFQGDISQGINSINKVINQDSIFSNEAKLFKFILNTYVISEQHNDSNFLVDFIHKNSSNLAIQFMGTSLLIRMGRSEKALEILKSAPDSHEYITVPFLKYYLGEIYLQKGKYRDAMTAYNTFVTKHIGFNFIKDTYYKLFLCSVFTGNDTLATKFLLKINRVGETIVEVDKTAQKYYQKEHNQKTYLSNSEITLKKAQLATEGGYYENGIKLLNQLSVTSNLEHKSTVEYLYRLARIQDLSKETDKALGLYLKVIKHSLNEDVPLPFAPRSCLYLGDIYRYKNDIVRAREYYLKALTYDGYEGNNSVEIKAKASLNKLPK